MECLLIKAKIKSFSILALMLAVSGAYSISASIRPLTEANPPRLLPVRVNGKWGYINEKGNIVIKPRFAVAGNFFEGRAAVRGNDSWFYYIDESGDRISADQYFRFADDFSEGLAMVQGEGFDDKIGFIDKTGRFVIEPIFDGFDGKPLWGFTDGLSIVSSNGKLGYIDRNGKFVIQPQYDSASHFSEGLAVVTKDGKYLFIDREGIVKIDDNYATAFGFSEGFASISYDRQKFGVIDKSGKIVIGPRFDWLGSFSEGLAVANIGMAWYGHQKSGGKWGFIDKTGSTVIEMKYDTANPFSEGLAPVSINGKWGFIDKTGITRIRLQFDWAEQFEMGISKVTINEKIGYIDRSGKYIWKPRK